MYIWREKGDDGDIFAALPLVSWAVALGSPAVPSGPAYNWTFLVFRPTAKMVRFIKSNCAGEAHDLQGKCPTGQPLQDETGFDLMFNSLLFNTLQNREYTHIKIVKNFRF